MSGLNDGQTPSCRLADNTFAFTGINKLAYTTFVCKFVGAAFKVAVADSYLTPESKRELPLKTPYCLTKHKLLYRVLTLTVVSSFHIPWIHNDIIYIHHIRHTTQRHGLISLNSENNVLHIQICRSLSSRSRAILWEHDIQIMCICMSMPTSAILPLCTYCDYMLIYERVCECGATHVCLFLCGLSLIVNAKKEKKRQILYEVRMEQLKVPWRGWIVQCQQE